MSNPKYLYRNPVTGQVQEVIATETGPVANVVVATGPGGTIDPSLLPISGASSAVVGESLNAGAYVYVKLAGSPAVPTLYNAVWASGGNQAIGFVLSGYSPTQVATYYDSGSNSALSALTVGDRYYGDPSNAGGVTTTVPTGVGVLSQFLGTASSPTSLESAIADAIILAS